MAVSLFHFFFAWNDFFLPLLYLAVGARAAAAVDRDPGSTTRCTRRQPTLIQASAMHGDGVPIVIFFLAQRAFMRGVVCHGGVETVADPCA